MSCKKIPDLIELDSFGGDYEQYEEAVYSLYKTTFEEKSFSYNNKPIVQKIIPMYKEKSGTFWHIISNGPDEASRTPDLRRYERIAWPSHVLGYCQNQCSNILIWKNKRKGKSRVLLWCRDINYLVVLDEKKDYYIFWTAYPITYKHTRDKLLTEYNEYINNNN